jgi:capsid assembly protease
MMPVRAFDLALGQPWAIQPESLQQILAIAERLGDGPEAVAAELGRPLENTRTVRTREGVAIVPVTGPIFRRANMFCQCSGATSVEVLGRDLRTAAANPDVKAILLEIDSPGGEANSIEELAGVIAELREKKPIHAYVGGLGASAAYWIASAAETITAGRTALLGSIGVVMGWRRSEEDEVTFVSSNAPNKRPDVDTEAGRAEVQRIVDELEDVFIGAVARNRGVARAVVLQDFGRGGLVMGPKAVRAGMADRTGTFEGLFRKLKSGSFPKRQGALADGAEVPHLDDEDVTPALAGEGDDTMTMEEQLAAVRAELATANANVLRLTGELSAANTEVERQKPLVAVAEKALADLKGDYLALSTKLGRTETESKLIAEMLVEKGDYARLKDLRDGAQAEVFEKFPAGPSANVKTATGGGAPVISAEKKAELKALAARNGLKYEDVEAQHLAAMERRGLAA